MDAAEWVGVIGGGLAILGTLISCIYTMVKTQLCLRRHDRILPILVRGNLATLDGLVQLGANGEVTIARKELHSFLSEAGSSGGMANEKF